MSHLFPSPFLATALALLACSPGAPGPEPEAKARPAVERPRPADASPAEIAPGPPEIPRQPVPLARYGDLGRPRIATPVEATPLAKGSVVLIVIDALNAGHLSAYGYARRTSPRIEGLADGGILFTDWVSNSSWTRPSITTILTGWPKRRHGVELGGRLDDRHTSIAEVYREAGFRTAGFVGNPLVRKVFGYDKGFEVYEDTKDHAAFPRGRILVDKALKWLKRVGDQPFFLLVFLTDPHTPYRPPEDFRGFLAEVGATSNTEYPLREYERPLPEAEHRAIVAAYDGEVAYADAQVGRLLDGLAELGLRDRTSIAVTADHGETFGEHNCYLHSYHQWEPALRVPFVLASPAIPVRGAVEDRPYTHLDLLPTLAALSGIEPPAGLDGRSYLADLRRPEANRDRWIYSQYDAHGVKRETIRNGARKLVRHHLVDTARFFKSMERQREDSNVPRADPRKLPSLALDGERLELFDLVEDPGEAANLYDMRRGEAFVGEMLDQLRRHGSLPAAAQPIPELSAETLEALREAGYIR